jgi:hypothetical protein
MVRTTSLDAARGLVRYRPMTTIPRQHIGRQPCHYRGTDRGQRERTRQWNQHGVGFGAAPHDDQRHHTDGEHPDQAEHQRDAEDGDIACVQVGLAARGPRRTPSIAPNARC